MLYKYHVENGSGMELLYECTCAGDVFSGVILASSAGIRRVHGINPSLTLLTAGLVLTCVVRSAHDPEKPGKLFTLYGDTMNHVTLQCPQPFADRCDPLTMIMSGKWLPVAL